MKKKIKKLNLHRETLHALSNLRPVVGAANTTPRTVCATGCVTNCINCNLTTTC